MSGHAPTSVPTFDELIDDLLQAHTDYERAEGWQTRRAREDYLVEKVKVVTILQLLAEQRAALLEALQAVVADIHEYERVNNLAPTPGRQYCWDSVARAHDIIAKATSTIP